jgi:pimeloyl-ACP methyl ester carboxylesterase
MRTCATSSHRRISRSRDTSTIVHGDADPIFAVAAAEELARAIPGARLNIVSGMGHDLPPAFWPVVFDAVCPPDSASRG